MCTPHHRWQFNGLLQELAEFCELVDLLRPAGVKAGSQVRRNDASISASTRKRTCEPGRRKHKRKRKKKEIFHMYVFLRLCLCLRRCVVRVNQPLAYGCVTPCFHSSNTSTGMPDIRSFTTRRVLLEAFFCHEAMFHLKRCYRL